MPIGQRVILIGGGPNALVTAFYLAKGGFKPLILERREFVGGGAITEEFAPGFRASTLAHTIGPHRNTPVKRMPYESGMDPVGDARLGDDLHREVRLAV